jgi:surface protein
MIGKIEFPDNLTWTMSPISTGDLLGEGFEILDCTRLYQYSANSVIDIKFDTSKCTNMSYMFYNCSNLTAAPQMDTSNVADMSYMFGSCYNLTSIPQLDTSKCTNMYYMFQSCSGLTTIPQLDTSNVTNMDSMFNSCSGLTTIPQLDTSNVTNMNNMFNYCKKLTELPDFNCVKVTSFGASYNCWLYNTPTLKKLGVVDCDSVNNIQYFFCNSENPNLTDFGGCRNLGKASTVSNTNGSNFMVYAPNLTYESIMNVINLLYDRTANGLSGLTLKLHSNQMAKLSEDDIAIATNKGWSLTA